MPTLNLGVIDVAYTDGETKGANTTGEVAQILEAEYHIMRVFLEENEDMITDAILNGYEGAIESLAMGAPPQAVSASLNLDKVEARFRDFLSNEEMKLISGKNTQAAVDRETLRRKTKKGPQRPAFVDTGLYQASFKAWVDP
ncbi:hypothetical protein [Robbsia andropogonis]|uniref:hypothetical protein n=1 Tax=Robbsia andropogonis TaxID=28092 RepID=UPI002A6B818D|nr:hypothetical protein [Robbsia andropogonis]